MIITKQTIKTSDFGNGETEIFIYSSNQNNNSIQSNINILFVLKGLFSRHEHFLVEDFIGNNYFENNQDFRLIKSLIDYTNIVFINTSHKNLEGEQSRSDLYDGKTFDQEISDIKQSIVKVKDIFIYKNIYNHNIYFLGKSFGGTLLLGLDDIKEAKAIFMTGSGCGKSNTTTKTLLRTMPEESLLLDNIKSNCSSRLYFFTGDKDEVVPISSQEKIVKSLGEKSEYVVLSGVDHKFETINACLSEEPFDAILNKIRSVMDINSNKK